MKNSPNAGLIIAVAGLAAVGLAACGSGDSGGAAASRSTRTATVTASGTSPESGGSQPTTTKTATATADPGSAAGSGASGASGAAASSSVGTQSTAASSGASSSGATKLARCTVKQLRIRVAGGDASMQGVNTSLRFTNTGTSACVLTGTPGVSYVAGSDGHQVGKPATRVVGHAPVTVAPGGTVSAGLFISSAPRKTAACTQISVRGLRVYPPGSYQAAYVAHASVACAAPLNGPYLKVGPIKAGANNTL